jgi:L-fuconolactonase
LIIDSHCHVGAVWYEPAETLLFQMDRCGVDRAVLVQMLGQFDNAYQQACASRWPDRFVSVVAVDPARPDAIATLRRLAAEGARGVRLRPAARSPGDDALAIWREAAALGLAVSCVGTTAQFTAPEFADLLTEVAHVQVVLEHLGGVARPDADDSAEKVWDLARFPNVALKIPGLGQLSKRRAVLPADGAPFEPGGDAILQRAVLAYSPGRLMWGSDFPVVSTREGYAEALAGPRAALDALDDHERRDIFGRTAERLFPIHRP